MIQKHLTMHHFEQPLKTWWSCHVEDGKFNIYNLTIIRKLDSVVFLSYTEYIWFTIHCYYYIPLNFVWKCFRYVLHEITTKMLTIYISSHYWIPGRTKQIYFYIPITLKEPKFPYLSQDYNTTYRIAMDNVSSVSYLRFTHCSYYPRFLGIPIDAFYL